MKKWIQIAVLVGLVSLMCCHRQIEEIAGSELEERLDPFLMETIESFGLPGIAVGIVKDGEIVYAKGFGFKNIETRTPITEKTLFHMASVSKPFVATAVMQLVEAGKIHLQEKVFTYLPYFKLEGDSYKEITIQQMLSHTSGMPDVENYEWDSPQYDEEALERYVRSLSEKTMIGKPGERYAYSNMAFECLGDVIAKASRMSFSDYEKKHILDPAGMTESDFLKPDFLPENWAAPHVRTVKTNVWDGYPYNRKHGPSSTLHSSVLDMCKWAIVNLNQGSFDGEKILTSSSYSELWKRQISTNMGSTQKYVGLSWFMGDYRGKKTIGHSGGDMGFSANLILLPKEAAAVVVLCNFLPAPVGKVTEAILDILLGFKPEPLKSPVSVQVFNTLEKEGVEAAVEKYRILEKGALEDYNIDVGQWSHPVAMVIELGRPEDAEKLAKLYAEIMPESFLELARNSIGGYLKTHPENEAATILLEIFR